ncbi:MAG: hypothetical protein ABI811_20530 [Acidobacteriota bacterium]
MKRKVLNIAAPVGAVLAALFLLQMPADSQAPAAGKAKIDPTAPAGTERADPTAAAKGKAKGKGKAAPQGPAPKTVDGKIDFSGIWNGGGPIGDIKQGLPPGEELPLLPAAKALMDKRQSQDDPEANCLPTGVPRIAPYPWRIVQTPTHIFFLFEGNIHTYRQIFMDGRAFPKDDDIDPTWFGYSIGRIEGNTLIVETKGYNDKFWFDFKGTPHTELMTTVERYTRNDLGTLTVETTITDPGAYSKPFTIKFTATLRPGEELMEYICQENNQDAAHIRGPASLE